MNPHLILPVGTQVVSRVEIASELDKIICVKGAVGVIIKAPTDNGYVMSQFKKMEQDLRTQGQVRLKHAMHLIRLLLSGISILEDGIVPVKVEKYREELLAIRQGEMPWEDVNNWRLSLHQDFDMAFRKTTLPERPNYEQANEFLIKARRSQI